MCKEVVPRDQAGILAYLSSGIIKGIGPETAKAIVARFGDKTMEVLEKEPDKLLSVKGIAQKKLKAIIKSYGETKALSDLMIYLAPFGVSMKKVAMIREEFGDSSLRIVKTDPFQLCKIKGFGFMTVDSVARKTKVSLKHPLRYEDEGFSGGNLERPQFKQMMKDSQKIEFAAIVVYRLDRISRNIGDFAKLIEDLGDRHIDFISIREQFDTSSPMGRAMMYIASVFSQLERETIAERIRDNMHELSKTGRWLGGTTPTGYASESLSSVTVDGKVKKACKLKPIPEEIQLVKTIFSVFTESGSLSKTDQYLLEHRCVTKRGKQFTRFAIRGILTNPVYMIADDTAYQYLKENNVDLFAEPSEFDGEHGIMAYNRTLQRPGKATQIRPMEDWIVAVGKHPGIISGANWVRVQSMLDVNKSKSYRKPRSNVALLSGLLRCGECGDYMRPKLTGRTNANGELIYTYMCSTKERSHGTVCSMKNCNGNTLDAKIVEEIRKVATDKKDFGQLLSKTKKVINDNKASYEAELTLLVKNHAETEARIKRLVESLSVASETSAKYVMEQIDELHRQSEQEQTRIAELEKLARQSNALSQNLFFYRDMIESFADTVDSTTIEERRRLLRTIVKKVVWDGKNVYVYLFAEDGELNLPPIGQLMCPSGEDSE